jgi:poly(A) polymerase
VETLESPLDGREIMALLGEAPSPEVGRIKAALREMVLEGELAPDDRDRARALVVEWSARPD